jgi:signal transduction histidine kinase
MWLRMLIRSELSPLRQLSRNVRHFDPLLSGAKLLPVTRAELQPIHKAITELAGSLARHVANERAFAAHAAHALRTPLAGMDAQLAMALRECTPDLKPRLQRTRDAANRLTRVVTALLTLFRSGTELHVQENDLSALIDRIPIDQLAISVLATTPVRADPDLLAAALMNLLDNAVRHGARHLSVRACAKKSRQILLIQDDGPGINQAQRRQIQRALNAQDYESGHVGLGLMLADLVARAHGGALRLVPSATGFAVILKLALSVDEAL